MEQSRFVINFLKENLLAIIIIICFIWLSFLELKEKEVKDYYDMPVNIEVERLV